MSVEARKCSRKRSREADSNSNVCKKIKSTNSLKGENASFNSAEISEDPSDESVTHLNLREILPKLEAGEPKREAPWYEFHAFRKEVRGDVKELFKTSTRLTSFNGAEIRDLLSVLFAKYPYSKQILTISYYDKAELDGCKISWGIFRFCDQWSVQTAAKMLDGAILGYLSDNELVFNEENIRSIWEHVNFLAKH